MGELEAELQAGVKKYNDRLKSTQRERYRLAKDLGFSTAEAVVLHNWGKGKIIKIAKERGYAIPPTPPLEKEAKSYPPLDSTKDSMFTGQRTVQRTEQDSIGALPYR